ncbi:MAG: efflux RND transporter permease subunit, partial [Spirochaetota bacterium]
DELKNLKIPVKEYQTVPLSEISDAGYRLRAADTISRVNGEKRVVLYIQTSGSANLVSLSRELRKETKKWQAMGFEIDIILDTGEKIEGSILNVFKAIGTGILIVSLFLSVFTRNLWRIAVLCLAIPLTGFVAIALLSLLSISLDHLILSGIAVGIGMIVDTGIILSESLRKKPGEKGSGVEDIIPPLISSTLTTIIVLFPLYFMEDIITGIKQVTLSITLLLLCALLLSIFFIPPYLKPLSPVQRKPGKKCRRKIIRLFYGFLLFIIKGRKYVIAVSALIVLVMIAGIIRMGKDLTTGFEQDSIFAHMEFESGATVESVDERTNHLSKMIQGIPGIVQIETTARPGAAEMVMRYDAKGHKKENLLQLVTEMGRRIPKGFFYIPEATSLSDRKMEITVSGGDNKLLRDIAKNAAARFQAQPWVTQVVLHFKDPPPAWLFKIDHSKTGASGITASEIAASLRWFLQGPVAVKWIEDSREIDLRVLGEKNVSAPFRTLQELPIISNNGNYKYLKSLGSFSTDFQASKIFRKNRQRAVYFSVHTKKLTINRTIELLWSVLKTMETPKGYAFELDKQVVRLNRHFDFLWLVLALALLLIYMVLASHSESLAAPLLILSIVPLSLSIPIIALWATGKAITIPVIVGLIIISGIIVNNSILVVDRMQNRLKTAPPCARSAAPKKGTYNLSIILSIRSRLKSMLLTSGTTILGTLPLVFTSGGEAAFTSSLAFVVLWGILGSLSASIGLLPSIILCSSGGSKIL